MKNENACLGQGEDGLLTTSVQRSLRKVVELNLKDCW